MIRVLVHDADHESNDSTEFTVPIGKVREATAAATRFMQKLEELRKTAPKRYILGHIGDLKIQAIKELREITGLGLKESKDAIEGSPIALTDDQLASVRATSAILVLKRAD